jgi:glycosyltransferase involved in cell wall biosynthesis
LRVAWFTPVREGAIAEYSRGVLAALVRLCEPRLFCHGPADHLPAGISVADLAAEPEALADLASFDAVFYNFGHDCRQHVWIFDVARLHPGIGILHDRTLHRFFVDYYLQHLRRPDLYITRMAEQYGVPGLTAAHRVLGPRLDSESARLNDHDLLRFTFTEEALRLATGAVVHSRWHGAIVRKFWSGPLCEAWLPTQRPSASSIPAESRREESVDDRLTLMTVGRVEPSAHVADVIELLAEHPDLAARTRYVIAGPSDPADPYVRELTATIAESRLGGTVTMLGQLPPVEVDRYARAADVFVNLRNPDVEGCSMSLMYELPFGKPVITYDSSSFAELPDEAVAKVATGDGAGLRRRLEELIASAARRQAIGTAAKRFADGHGARDYAQELLRFAEHAADAVDWQPIAQEASRAVAERIAAHIGDTLASLGVKPDSPGVEAVISEARSLLWPPPS